MKKKLSLIALAILAVSPTAAYAGNPWGPDVRHQFNLCEANFGPFGLLVPCWAPGLW
jgi:hypothetical protein